MIQLEQLRARYMAMHALRLAGAHRGAELCPIVAPHPVGMPYLKNKSLEKGEILLAQRRNEGTQSEVEDGEIVEQSLTKHAVPAKPARRQTNKMPRRPLRLVIPDNGVCSSRCSRDSERSDFDIPSVRLNESSRFVDQAGLCELREGEVSTHMTRSILNAVQVPVRTEPMDIPERHLPALVLPTPPASSRHGVFNMPLGQVDEILLPTPIGARQVSPVLDAAARSLFIRSTFDPAPLGSNNLVPPMTRLVDDSPPVSPEPITPVSTNFINGGICSLWPIDQRGSLLQHQTEDASMKDACKLPDDVSTDHHNRSTR